MGEPREEPREASSARLWLFYALGLVLALPLYLLFATERFSPTARLLAWLGLCTASLPSLVLLTRPRSPRSSVAATGLIIALFYHLAVFHERALLLRWGFARITDESIERGLLLAALATPALYGGWALAGALGLPRLLPHLRLEVPEQTLRRAGVGVVLLSVGVHLLWVWGLLPTSAAATSVLSVLSPMELGFAMVMLPLWQGRGERSDRLWFLILFLLTAVLALSVGMIMIVIRPIILLVAGGLLIARRVRLGPVLAGLLVILIMQPVKGEFRQRVWDRKTEASVTERVQLYVDLVVDHWFGSAQPEAPEASVQTAAARTAAALVLANYFELTPSTVPFQYGRTYRYFLYALVPRVLYPEKPVAQFAEIWAAVMYGYTTHKGTAHVMVGLSQMGEAYVNFGFLGGLLMLAFIGALYRGLDEVLGHEEAGSGALCVYLYLVLNAMINSEGSLAQFWGGVLQQVLFYGALMALLRWYALRGRSDA